MKAQRVSKYMVCAWLSMVGIGVAYADNNEHRLIQLQADVTREVSNDQMQATLYSQLSDQNATVLANKITKVMNQSTALAKQYPQIEVKTGNQSTYPIYDDKQKLKVWQGRAEIILKSKDFKAMSQLIAQLQQQLQLQNIQFSVSEQTQQRIENELYVEASKAFQARAVQQLAPWHATHYELVNLQLSTAGSYRTMTPRFGMNMAMMKTAGDVEAQNVEAGQSEMRVTATGTIQLQ